MGLKAKAINQLLQNTQLLDNESYASKMMLRIVIPAQRSVPQNIPHYEDSSLNFRQIVLGAGDDVVNPADSLQFLSRQLPGAADLRIHLRQNMAHRIPVGEFEDEVERFFGELGY